MKVEFELLVFRCWI